MRHASAKGLGRVVVALTSLWVVLLIAQQTWSPPATHLDDAISAVATSGLFRTIVYANAALLTAATVALFTVMGSDLSETHAGWPAVAGAFVPIYGLGNLVAYLSQLFVVPELVRLYAAPESHDAARLLLGMTIHTWPSSAVAFLNALSYAALGVPSIAFGLLLAKRRTAMRLPGSLLCASGILSIVALFGLGARVSALSALSPVSGMVFLAALVLMDRAW